MAETHRFKPVAGVGHPTRVIDRHGVVWLEAEWRGQRLEHARFRLPCGGSLELRTRACDHPMLGVCDAALVEGRQVARIRAVEWGAPRELPAIDVPGALPAGGGTALLNFLASCATGPLRYRGPYPSESLFDTLLQSFRVSEAGALSEFTAGAEQGLVCGYDQTPMVEFEPAPFTREEPAPGVCVQMRDGLERAYVWGGWFEAGFGPRRLRRTDQGWAATFSLGGIELGRVALFSPTGELLDGPHPIESVENPLVGVALPAAVRDFLLALLPQRAVSPLRAALTDVLCDLPLYWGDTGVHPARLRGEAVLVHAGLAEQLEADELLLAVAECVEPLALRLAQRRLSERFELLLGTTRLRGQAV